MNAIVLHPLRFEVNLFHKKGQQGDGKGLRQFRVNRLKRLIVAASVVRWQFYLHQQRLRARGFNLFYDFPERGGKRIRRKPAQAIVAAKLNQHPARLMLFKQRRQARKALLGGVAADARVHHAHVALLPFIVQQRRPGGIRRHTITGAQAVAQHQ